MLGLTVTALQHFTLDNYGHEAWRHVVKAVLGDFQKFEALLVYDDDVVFALIKELAESNNRIRKDFEEDIGNYLFSSKNMKSLRRLLRFGGATFEDFVMSLDDLNERVDLALSELNLPTVQSRQQDDGSYLLRVEDQWSGFENVIVGILRALADDYGVLVLVDVVGHSKGSDEIKVEIIERDFAKGAEFELIERAAL